MMSNERRNKTTAVLAHAAWADGSSWNKVTIELQRRGFNVVAKSKHRLPAIIFSYFDDRLDEWEFHDLPDIQPGVADARRAPTCSELYSYRGLFHPGTRGNHRSTFQQYSS